MHNFPRPTAETLEVCREPERGTCPDCGSQDIAAYRVLSEGGFWNVSKCQDCLFSLRRDPGPMFGSFVPLKIPR